MKFVKKPTSFDVQVEKLKSRGLIIEDEVFAEKHLSSINYYRLRGYTYPFQDINKHFIKPIRFEEIIDLYFFDSKLRSLVFDAIERIEIALRTQIIYHFSLAFGSHWQEYENLFKNKEFFYTNNETLQIEIERSKEDFIKHYLRKYTNPKQPPSWMTFEVASFGLLSKIFMNLKRNEYKENIAKHFGIKDTEVLENWMLCFCDVRNICAHHSRLWNRVIKKIRLLKKPLYEFITNKNIHTNKMYSILSCIQYMLERILQKNTFKNDLIELMKTCPLNQAKNMGFPENWQDDKFWQI